MQGLPTADKLSLSFGWITVKASKEMEIISKEETGQKDGVKEGN